MSHSPIIIIGAGPAGLMAAQEIAKKGYKVHVYEQNKAAARKFLVAGHGGFNLTHSEDIEDFISRYDRREIDPIIKSFTNKDTVEWLNEIGIQTYVGSSGKIFPTKDIKPIQVLNAWLSNLRELGVEINFEYQLVDFDNQSVQLKHKDEFLTQRFDKLILSLGGGSWAKTGSNAKWVSLFEDKGIHIHPLQSANSGYNTCKDFSELEGQVLKNICLSYGDNFKHGEMVFTSYGVEGSVVYYMNRFTRNSTFPYSLKLDLKPTYSLSQLEKQLNTKGKITHILKDKIKLNKTAILLLKKLDKETFNIPKLLAAAIKYYPIEVQSLRPIDEVISTAGGICFDELNIDLSLKKHPNVYCIGEMLDWEAPTGGYLLQACFSMGYYVGKSIN